MHTNKQGNISTRLKIIFMADAASDFGALTPSKLPDFPLSLNVYILRDQSILLTKSMLRDEAFNLKFDGFIENLKENFQQYLTIQTQPRFNRRDSFQIGILGGNPFSHCLPLRSTSDPAQPALWSYKIYDYYRCHQYPENKHGINISIFIL